MISVVITAAGNSTRFGENKMLVPIMQKPLFIRTIEQFLKNEEITEIIVATRKENVAIFNDLIDKDINTNKKIITVEGGKERIESLKNGINKASGEIIITHDGARPLVSKRMIDELIDAVKDTGAAMTAVNPVATVKKTEDDSLIITDTLLREKTWIAQTPQIFTKNIISCALDKAIKEEYFVPTDDSEIVAVMTDTKVKVVKGDNYNLKITFPSDVAIMNEYYKVYLNDK